MAVTTISLPKALTPTIIDRCPAVPSLSGIKKPVAQSPLSSLSKPTIQVKPTTQIKPTTTSTTTTTTPATTTTAAAPAPAAYTECVVAGKTYKLRKVGGAYFVTWDVKTRYQVVKDFVDAWHVEIQPRVEYTRVERMK